MKSAINVLSRAEDININIIPTRVEDGISIIAFGLKEIVDKYGSEVTEIAMDSTCKFNQYLNSCIITPKSYREDECGSL